MNKMAFCGAFHALPTKSPSNKSSKSHGTEETTVFTFQLSPGGTGAVDSQSLQSSCSESVESKRTKSSRELKSKSSKGSRKKKDVDEYRNVRKALFDAATESESIATDPLVGMVVSSCSKEPGSKKSGSSRKKIDRAGSKSDCKNESVAAADKSNPITSGKGNEDEGDVGEDIPDKRQLLWHAAMQYHRSRHGRYKQDKQTARKRHGDKNNNHRKSSKRKQLQELDVLVNSSKESLDTTNNIRKRGLKNIHQYLPSLSDTETSASRQQQQLEHCQNSNSQNSQQRPKVETNDVIRQHAQTNVDTNEEYCPICSCRLTILYSSRTTHRLTEIHSGCDTPSSKTDTVLPPYCIGCRAYLVYESWDEVKRRRLLQNFEQRLELYSPSGSRDDMDSCPLEDFRNGRLIVVASSGVDSCDYRQCETPKISNSSSEVSSFSRNSFDMDVVPRMFTDSSLSNSLYQGAPGEHCGEDGRGVEMTVDDGPDSTERKKQQVVDENFRNDAISDASTIGSDDDPFEDLKTPKDGEMPKTNSEFASTPDDTPGADSNATLTPPKTNVTNESQNHPSYKEVDEAITFKSPTLAAKHSMIQAQLAIASTFSEEFAIFSDYNIKKAAATRQIVKCLHKGYELTTVKCVRCEMPLMKRGEEEICVACPAIMKRVRRIVREKRYGLKTPKMSNKKEFGDFEQVETRDDDEESVEDEGSEVNASALVDSGREAAPHVANEFRPTVYGNPGYNAATIEIEEMEGGIAGQSRAIPAGCSDYWVAHSASQVSNNQANSRRHQGNCHPKHLCEHVMPPQHHQLQQQHIHSQNQQIHCTNAYHFQAQNVHQFPYQSSGYHQNSGNSPQVFHREPAFTNPSHVNGSHSQQFIQKTLCQHNSDSNESFHQMPHLQPSNDHNFSPNKYQQLSVQQKPSSESGHGSFHSIVNGDSIESVTKCPRDLPPGELIWDYNPSHYPANNGMLSNETQGGHDKHSHYNMQPERNCSAPASANVNPMQSPSCSEKIGSRERKALDSGAATLQSGSSHKTESASHSALSPRQEKFKQIWNECVPVSFELNSDAKRKVINSESMLVDNKSSGTFGQSKQYANAAMTPVKSIHHENAISPSTATTTPHLSIEEERFCERLKQIANKLKSTADEFAFGEKDNCDQSHTPLPINDHSNTTHNMVDGSSSPILLQNDVDRVKNEQRSPSQVITRNPLEPIGIESDNCKLSIHSMASTVAREARQSVVHERSFGVDPPGRDPGENVNVVGHNLLHVENMRSPKGHIRSPQVRRSITPRRTMVDPPEEVGANPESRGGDLVRHCTSTPQRKTGYLRRSTPTKLTGVASQSSVTTSQSKLSHLRTPKSRTPSTSYERHSMTSPKSSCNANKSTKSGFHLNIPSWVDDEIETPIKPTKSFGETSMDQLMRKIDEIENDFSTIVASLPGSDGLSLRFTKSDDNSTLASKTTFDMQEEAENIEHQLESSTSFESQESQDRLMSGILQQMRIVQDQIQQLDSCEMDDGSRSEKSQESQGMAELLGRLAHAAESLRSLQVE